MTRLKQPRHILEYIEGGRYHYIMCSEGEQEEYMRKHNVKHGTYVQTAEQLLETLVEKVGDDVAQDVVEKGKFGDAVEF